jgi:hypothetical protein
MPMPMKRVESPPTLPGGEGMDRIYSSADTVVVWLGNPTKRSSRGLRYMETLPDSFGISGSIHTKDHILSLNPREIFDQVFPKGDNISALSIGFNIFDLNEILIRECFQRTWLVQEIVLAKVPCFYVGSTEVSLESLLRGVNLFAALGKLLNL